MRCAVGKCNQSNNKISISGKSVHFYSFPKDKALLNHWVKFCNRQNRINVQHERICALHFKEEYFERNLKFEMGFSNRRAPKLKPGAVPTIETTDMASGIETVTCDEDDSAMTDISEGNLQQQIKTFELKIAALRQENELLKMLQTESEITIKNLSSQVRKLSFTHTNLEKALRSLFTEDQINKIKTGDNRQNFTETEIAQAITLYSANAKVYNLLKEKNFPLPSVRILQRWSEKLDVPSISNTVEGNKIRETPKIRVLTLEELKAKKMF